jgi:tetratricopeptide (TPR) repeat protein
MKRWTWIAAPVALLAACASPPRPEPPPRVQRDWVAEIEAEAARAESAVDVVPLADPELDDLRVRARALSAAGSHAEAEAVWRQSIALRGEDPALWQALAENLLAQQRWADAAAAAAKSAELGPRVGALCLRSRFATFAARIELGDAVGAAPARMQVEACVAAAPARF